MVVHSTADPSVIVAWTLQSHPELSAAALTDKVLPAVRSRLPCQGRAAESQLASFDSKDAVELMAAVKLFIAKGW